MCKNHVRAVRFFWRVAFSLSVDAQSISLPFYTQELRGPGCLVMHSDTRWNGGERQGPEMEMRDSCMRGASRK